MFTNIEYNKGIMKSIVQFRNTLQKNTKPREIFYTLIQLYPLFIITHQWIKRDIFPYHWFNIFLLENSLLQVVPIIYFLTAIVMLITITAFITIFTIKRHKDKLHNKIFTLGKSSKILTKYQDFV